MNRHTNFGFSSILISFIMICIVTFSALALVTANSDYKLSRKVADRNQQYYQAQELAYEKLSQIDSSLESCYVRTGSQEEYKTAVRSALADMDGTWSDSEDALYFTYTSEITENQFLEIVLEIVYPTARSDGYYRIAKWHTVQTEESFEEQPLNLMGSGEQ